MRVLLAGVLVAFLVWSQDAGAQSALGDAELAAEADRLLVEVQDLEDALTAAHGALRDVYGIQLDRARDRVAILEALILEHQDRLAVLEGSGS